MSETRPLSFGILLALFLTGFVMPRPSAAQSFGWDRSNVPRQTTCEGRFFRASHAVGTLVPGPAGVLYEFGAGPVARSNDGGATWKYTAAEFRQVTGMVSLSDGSVMLGAYSDGGGAYRLRDVGRQLEETGLTKRVLSLAATFDGSRVYAVTSEVRLMVSEDNGDTWKLVNPDWYVSVVRTGPGGSVYVKSGNGYYASENGDFWRFVYSDRFPYPTLESGSLLSVDSEGIQFSEDDGQTWRRVLELPGAKLLTNRQGGQFAVARDGAVYRFSDSGRTWRQVAERFPDECAMAGSSVIDAEGHIVVGSTNGVVYRSKDSTQNERTPDAQVPEDMVLLGNYPNPFNPRTTIKYTLAAPGDVNLRVFDMLGREVRSLVEGRMDAGDHSATFDAVDLPSGTYLYRLEFSGKSYTGKMTLLR